MPINNNVKHSIPTWLWPVTAVAAAILASVWWFMNLPVKLNEDQYATTLALYRICNQRSEDGLDQIEAILLSFDSRSGARDSSRDAIQAIIEDARQERWHQATMNCRRLLNDQVRR